MTFHKTTTLAFNKPVLYYLMTFYKNTILAFNLPVDVKYTFINQMI